MPDQPILNTFLILILSVGIIGGMFYALKKFIDRSKGTNSSNNIKIVSKQPLSSKSSLYIIEIDSRKFLIGVAEKNISLISELSNNSDDISPSVKTSIEKSNNSNELSFKEFLKSTISKG